MYILAVQRTWAGFRVYCYLYVAMSWGPSLQPRVNGLLNSGTSSYEDSGCSSGCSTSWRWLSISLCHLYFVVVCLHVSWAYGMLRICECKDLGCVYCTYVHIVYIYYTFTCHLRWGMWVHTYIRTHVYTYRRTSLVRTLLTSNTWLGSTRIWYPSL